MSVHRSTDTSASLLAARRHSAIVAHTASRASAGQSAAATAAARAAAATADAPGAP
jgi:hypothetical protein